MTPLRQRMIREMQLRQFSQRTVESYVDSVAGLANHYHRSPDQLALEEVRSYLHHLLIERQLAQGTCNLRAAAITFLYREVLGQAAFRLGVRRKHTGKLPEVYSREELARLFQAAGNLQHRVFLMTTYAAGLRLSEVRHLRPVPIHSERMLIRPVSRVARRLPTHPSLRTARQPHEAGSPDALSRITPQAGARTAREEKHG